MLNQDGLVELYRELRDQKVLSIYADGGETDPAERKAWRTRVDHRLGELRRSLAGAGEGGGGNGAMEAAARHLVQELDRFPAFMTDRGWVGFATPEKLWYADTVPVPMPTLVVWEDGIRAAPYVRALKQARPVVVALADSRRARIFTYQGGGLAETDDFLADRDLGDLSDTNVSKRATIWSGVGGETATDAAHRMVENSLERMLKLVVERIGERVGRRGLLVVGGTSETAAQLFHHLPKELGERSVELPGLYLEMTDPEVKRKTEAAATELTQKLQEGLARGVVDLALSGGRGVLGDEGTAQALRERRVDTLILSRTLIRGHPDRADHLLGTAFEQGAEVEEISGPGAELLDHEGKGVGARLRW